MKDFNWMETQLPNYDDRVPLTITIHILEIREANRSLLQKASNNWRGKLFSQDPMCSTINACTSNLLCPTTIDSQSETYRIPPWNCWTCRWSPLSRGVHAKRARKYCQKSQRKWTRSNNWPAYMEVTTCNRNLHTKGLNLRRKGQVVRSKWSRREQYRHKLITETTCPTFSRIII